MSRRDPKAWIARLEAMAGMRGPLGQGEAAELRHLEAERAAMFVGPIASMSQAQLDAFMAWHASDQAARLGHLRQRALSPRQQAEQRATAVAIEAMSADELAEYFEARCRAAQQEITP